jgi:hypothetical protein
MNPVNEAHVAVITYFGGEKRESVLFLAAGLIAIGGAAVLWLGDGPYRAMSFPLVAVALIQLVVGGTVFFRTNAQAKDLHARLARDPRDFTALEIPRMEKVMRSFRLYKAIEIALLIAGIAGLVGALTSPRPTVYAVSLGLMLEAGLMLVFDVFAERRGRRYLEAVRRLV